VRWSVFDKLRMMCVKADIPYSRENEAVGIDFRRQREERRPELYPRADTA